ncbi:futalosine hydrolase [Streptomyces sp. NBC_01136]|uniref:futalosine hydrolase n=1 Tax=unclassified Streptomyces TaxID=2593676 RepID=UPI00324EDF36|nr:futalosine hydrolase [Streptomyces sp. NBC_01136]WST81129.1 futalosine hydrolase [Streptomyces sp. NBC_01136]
MTPVRLLVVTAVTAEREAAARGLDPAAAPTEHALPGHLVRRTGDGFAPGPLRADLLAAGVGPAAAAAATGAALTAAALREDPYHLVVAAGIGGGFGPHTPVGAVVVADRIVAADLGADSPEGFLPLDTLGFGRTVHHSPPRLATAVASALGAAHAPVLTVSTATGTAERARTLAHAHPDARAEAMEGFGVAEAAAAHDTPVLEIRTVSNTVGPRDRSAWRIGEALTALQEAFAALRTVLEKGAPPPYN